MVAVLVNEVPLTLMVRVAVPVPVDGAVYWSVVFEVFLKVPMPLQVQVNVGCVARTAPN
jgi:hypothetical protein